MSETKRNARARLAAAGLTGDDLTRAVAASGSDRHLQRLNETAAAVVSQALLDVGEPADWVSDVRLLWTLRGVASRKAPMVRPKALTRDLYDLELLIMAAYLDLDLNGRPGIRPPGNNTPHGRMAFLAGLGSGNYNRTDATVWSSAAREVRRVCDQLLDEAGYKRSWVFTVGMPEACLIEGGIIVERFAPPPAVCGEWLEAMAQKVRS